MYTSTNMLPVLSLSFLLTGSPTRSNCSTETGPTLQKDISVHVCVA